MKIISTTNVSKERNGHCINQTETLIESCGLYSVIEVTNISGWWEDRSVEAVIVTDNYEKAVECYKLNGGKLNETLD